MELKYYVLGKKDNAMLKQYLERFYELLCTKLSELQNANILAGEIEALLLHSGKRDFIMNPDYSSLIEYLHYECILKQPQRLGDVHIYQDKLQRELQMFLNKQFQGLMMNQGEKIPNTDIRLTDIDGNPYNLMEAHPDHKKTGGMIGWGEATPQQWLDVYKKTFEVLAVTDEGIYDELNIMIQKIVPLGTSRGVHNSCSYKECVGHLYMGYSLDAEYPEINNLEAAIHESSHNKLNLLLHFDKIILNDYQEIYYSPYRPDPRHLHGTYLGLHAFAPTIYILAGAFLKGLVPGGFWGEKIILYYVKNKLALRVLEKYGKFTPLGIEILDEMKYVMGLTDERIKKMGVPPESITQINFQAKQHFAKVLQVYPKLFF